MKRLIFALAAMFAVTALYAQKDSAKVVVTSDGSIVGHYVRQTAPTYVANPLDWEVEVPKSGHRKKAKELSVEEMASRATSTSAKVHR